jgi:hypothetical protein
VRIAAYVRGNPSRTNERVQHFGEALGATFSTRESPIECDLAIQAGFQISPAMADAMDRGVPIIILENPCWHNGDKPATYTWGYNGLNGLGFVPDTEDRPDRPHPSLQEWKDPFEGQITVFGQVESDKALRGADIDAWRRGICEILPHAHFREHPVMVGQNDAPLGPFEECMARTSLAVTYTSTVGAEAVILGIPTISCHEGSLAYAVSSHSIADAPVAPDRTEWIRELSYRHWRTSELVDTKYILSGYEEARAAAQQGEYDNMSNGRDQ